MSESPTYWDHVDKPEFTCRACGWSGSKRECSLEAFQHLYSLSCPECDAKIVNVPYPTLADSRQAAAAGNKHAMAELPGMERHFERLKKLASTQLKDASQLPDVPDGPIDVVWDLEGSNSAPQIVLRANDTELWREPAFWEDYERFPEVAEILEQRYGSRLRSITPTDASTTWLYGDLSFASRVVVEVNQRLKQSFEG